MKRLPITDDELDRRIGVETQRVHASRASWGWRPGPEQMRLWRLIKQRGALTPREARDAMGFLYIARMVRMFAGLAARGCIVRAEGHRWRATEKDAWAPQPRPTEIAPPRGVRAWSPKRKAAVVAAIRAGELSEADARERYALSEEELRSWLDDPRERPRIAPVRQERRT